MQLSKQAKSNLKGHLLKRFNYRHNQGPATVADTHLRWLLLKTLVISLLQDTEYQRPERELSSGFLKIAHRLYCTEEHCRNLQTNIHNGIGQKILNRRSKNLYTYEGHRLYSKARWETHEIKHATATRIVTSLVFSLYITIQHEVRHFLFCGYEEMYPT
jgi:hypothetical protein